MTRAVLLWTASSSLLILAVTALRALLGRRMGARLRYALWGVVVLRLLVPVQLFSVPLPASIAQPDRPQAVEPPHVSGEPAGVPAIAGPLPDDVTANYTAVPAPGQPETAALNAAQALGWLWLWGSAVAAAVFLSSNAAFCRRLRRVRVPLEDADCPLPVYFAEKLPSPCLFGVFRPAVYVTRPAAADPDILRHVLAHEYTHFRHGDHIWNILRCTALAVHWWNPLVWLAAALSRRDCELACDEGTLRRLGEGERFAYGRTLLTLVGRGPRGADLLSCATTMTGDGRRMAQRVQRIAHEPRRWLWAAALAVLLAVLVTVCAFGQAKETPRLPWPEDGDSLRYVRDNGGFPDEFAIRLDKDGAFCYYEGGLSSSYGRGTWTQEGDVICLTEDYHDKRHYFTLEEDALVFRAGEPERFIYLEVAGGERFSLDTDPPAPEWDWLDVHEQPLPAPDAILSDLRFSVPEGDGSANVLISGLDNMRVTWSADTSPSKGLLYFSGDLGVFCPSLAGRTASTGSAIWTDESRNAVSVVMNVEGGAGFYVHFVAEPDSGAISDPMFEVHDDGETFIMAHEEMAAMARVLAELLTSAEDYYSAGAAPAASTAPEETAALTPVFSLGGNEFTAGVDITGLDCKSAVWYEASVSDWVFAGRRELLGAKTLGYLSMLEPRFLGEAFAADEATLATVYYPEEGPLLFLGLDEHDNGWENPTTASVYAFVDLSTGTVEQKKHSGFDEQRAKAFTDEFLVDTARTLAGLIQGAAEYYDETAEAQRKLEAAQAALDQGNESDQQEGKEEWERQQAVEYQAVGVTMEGKNYYYQGQLVNIFLDIRANGAFYTLDTNPAGTVNVQILRDGNNKITGAAYMTEAEAAELLRDMRDG